MSVAVGILVMAALTWVPESPRWLLIKRRPTEAADVLQRLARMNGTELSKGHLKELELMKEEEGGKKEETAAAKTETIFDFFRHR